MGIIKKCYGILVLTDCNSVSSIQSDIAWQLLTPLFFSHILPYLILLIVFLLSFSSLDIGSFKYLLYLPVLPLLIILSFQHQRARILTLFSSFLSLNFLTTTKLEYGGLQWICSRNAKSVM